MRMGSSREHSSGKRSDFAQKLLNDLKLRKERLAVSQSSNRTSSVSADGSKRSIRGSKMGINAQNQTGNRSGNMQNKQIVGNASLTSKEASNQIVPYERGQRAERINLSTALAFALENAGKATRADPSGSTSILSFLHQIGRRTMGYGMERRSSTERHRPSSSQLPMIHLHIKEISKGTQKLNQIIKACSNGLNFGTYSIENGQELMKGAIDLEQALRMLVEIQDASDYMIRHPQKKNQIKLLDDDEDEDNITVERNEHKQLDLPRFSFDQASRNYQGIQESARADIKMRLAALAYHPTENKFNNGKATPTSGVNSHRRSVSYNPDGRTPSGFTEEYNKGNSSQPKAEKGRIPNVIAKLMGLGELPKGGTKQNMQNDFNSKTKSEEPVSTATSVTGTKKIEQRRKDSEQASHNIIQRVTRANKVAALENLVALQEGKKMTSNITMDVVIHHDAQTWEELNSTAKNQNSILDKERKQDAANQKKREDAEKVETKKVVFKEQHKTTPNMHRKNKATIEFKDKTKQEASKPLTEKNHTSKILSGGQQKIWKNLAEHPEQLKKSEPREVKHQAEERKQSSYREKFQLERQKGNASISNHLPKALAHINMEKKQSRMNKAASNIKRSTEVNYVLQSNKSPQGTKQKGKLRNVGHSFARGKMNDINQKSRESSPAKDRETESARVDNRLEKEEKPVQVQVAHKANEEKVHENEILQKDSEGITRQTKSMLKLNQPIKPQDYSLQEEKRKEEFNSSNETSQARKDMTKEAEACTSYSENSISNKQTSNVGISQAQGEARKDQLLHIPGQNKDQNINDMQNPTESKSYQETVLTNEWKTSGPVPEGNEAEQRKLNDEALMDVSLASAEQEKPLKADILESLTESENHLKKTLTKSRVFLDTAVVLLKLDIPLSSLQDGGRDYSHEDDNLILDCGYEIMKRKGRSQELSIHPFVNARISSTKVKSLDDLVKQLKNEFGKLKAYGGADNNDALVGDYLPKMLERDVCYNDPDLNCMWDMGWNDLMFAFIEKDDVIRDVERYVLNILVDEITRDLIRI